MGEILSHFKKRRDKGMFKENTIKLGIAPIAWTNDDMPELGAENTFEQCISEMALAGFNGSEVGNKYPRNIVVLKNLWNYETWRLLVHGLVRF